MCCRSSSASKQKPWQCPTVQQKVILRIEYKLLGSSCSVNLWCKNPELLRNNTNWHIDKIIQGQCHTKYCYLQECNGFSSWVLFALICPGLEIWPEIMFASTWKAPMVNHHGQLWGNYYLCCINPEYRMLQKIKQIRSREYTGQDRRGRY